MMLMLFILTAVQAFDSMSHNELLLKLQKYGITGDLWLWFKADTQLHTDSVCECVITLCAMM